jgi:hypothetical protein
MPEMIGITFPVFRSLKHEALLFDRIGIFDLKGLVRILEILDDFKWLHKEMRWLQENAVAFDPIDFPITGQGYTSSPNTSRKLFSPELIEHTDKDIERIAEMSEETTKTLQELGDHLGHASSLSIEQCELYVTSIDDNLQLLMKSWEVGGSPWLLRYKSIVIGLAESAIALPILPTTYNFPTGFETRQEEIMHLVLRRIPVPDDTVSWKQIQEWRSDPESKRKYWAIRNWITEMARGDLSIREVEEKIEFLTAEYEAHMRLHKMKYSSGVYETIVTIGAECLENLVKVKWSAAVKSLFSLKRQKINLLEAELKTPGSEIAYITDTKKRFS